MRPSLWLYCAFEMIVSEATHHVTTRSKEGSDARHVRTAFRNHLKHRKPGDLHTILNFCASNAISENFTTR